jgi:hypothetical protein
MCQDAAAGGIVSEDDLARLTNLFRQFEGATDPLSEQCREAEAGFHSLIEQIYENKVKATYPKLPLSHFHGHARLLCRKRIAKEDRPFPCV